MHVDKHQSFLQVDFNTLSIKDAYKVLLSFLLGMIKHSQSTQSNKFATSLQYLKKEVRKGIHFLYADGHQSFYKIIVFDGSGQIYSKYPKKEVGNVFEKSVAAPFVFYCDVKHLDTSCGSSHVYCYIIVSLHSLAQTINFLPKDNNAIIREHLCGEGLLSLFLCSKLMFFQ